MDPKLPDRRVDDPASDDWLSEQGEVEWDEAQGVARRGDSASTARAEASAAAGGRGLASYDPRRLTVVQRRRAIALVGLVALALVGIAVAVTVLGSDDEPAAPTTAAATTQPPTTEPATTAPAATPLTLTLPASGSLALGASGEEVETLQTALAALEFDPGAVDGDFGAATQEAVRAFQQANDLAADGIVGAETAETLNAVLAAEGITG